MAPATVRRAPYKDFLQPALHRRFSSTATCLFVLSYISAILLGNFQSLLWSWFPIGPVGIRTAFLFSSALAIIILRISQYHVGVRASPSPFLSAVSNLFTIQFLEAWLFYGFSSALFGLVYLWSASESADLRWIRITSGDRARLNQKPVFLAFYFAMTAATQAFLHIACDDDRIEIDASKSRNGSAKSTSPSSSMSLIATRLPGVVIESFMKSSTTWLLSYTLYFIGFQRPVWVWAMTFFRTFYNLPKTNMVPGDSVLKLSLVLHCIWAGFLLSITWAIGNYAFSLFMVKEPLKNGKPLTSESKDPNGSLLNGLKSKKMPIRCFAFWELAFIARDFEVRRKAIFEDIDRKDGPMWSQVYVLCLEVVKGLEKRIDEYGKPPPPPLAPAEATPVEPKPRTSAPLKDDPIFQSRPASRTIRGEVEKAIGQVARDPGNTPLSQLSPRALKTFRDAKNKMLTPEQQQALDPARASGFVQSLSLWLVRNEHVGWIFRQSFRRRFTAAVLGTPYAEASHHINAVEALSQLAVHSLTEDKFGNVHRDVATIVRTFTVVIRKLEAFKTGFPVHWTDTDGQKVAPEVDAVLVALKTGLAAVVQEFEPYSLDLRLSRTDIRLAKEASVQAETPAPPPPKDVGGQSEKRPDMKEVRE